MGVVDSALKEALDGLYSAFAGQNRPRAIDYCTHCLDVATVKRLLAPVPLRDVPAEPIRRYTVDVLSTAGSVADFRYFLPRILHLAVTDGFGGYPDLDLVMSKLRFADWRRWPAAEQRAVTAFMHAVWRATLTRFPADPGTEELLGAIAQIEDDLAPYLRAWEAALATHAGASHLLGFVRDTFGRAGREYWLTAPGWPDTAVAAVRAWLGGLSGTVAATAEAVTDEETGDVLLELLVSL
jgi:hypothetical protein